MKTATIIKSSNGINGNGDYYFTTTYRCDPPFFKNECVIVSSISGKETLAFPWNDGKAEDAAIDAVAKYRTPDDFMKYYGYDTKYEYQNEE
jgi:hypothetical protein